MSAAGPVPAARPTLHVIGAGTGQPSLLEVFPRWSEVLGLGADVVGVDLPVDAPDQACRDAVALVRRDPLARGALIAARKVDCFRAAGDLFDEIDPVVALTGAPGRIARRGDRLVAAAMDPLAAALALDAVVPAGHFARTGAEALVIGAGGAGIAVARALARPERGRDRPSRITVSDIDPGRLEALRQVADRLAMDIPVHGAPARRRNDNDRLMAALPAGSLVVDATGPGGDGGGSPVGDAALFPEGGYAWTLSCRADRVFLRRAEAQAAARRLAVAEGRLFLLYGWARLVAEVFAIGIPASGPGFARLAALADGRPALAEPA